MAAGNPSIFLPAIAANVEVEPFLFDFGSNLAGSGGSILSVDAVNITPVVGVDSDAASRIQAGPEIVPSLSNPEMLAAAVVVWIGKCLGDVTYLIQVVVSSSDGNAHPAIEARLPCYNPTGV